MTSKSFLRAAAATSIAISVLFATVASFAQSPPSPAATPVNAKVGHIRLWNIVLFNPSGLDLVAGVGPAAKTVLSASTANFSGDYTSLTPGRYTLTVYRTSDHQTSLKSFDVPLAEKSYFTILVVHLPGGQLSVELLNDTPDPTRPPVNSLTVRQVTLDSHAMVLTAQAQHTTPLEPGGVQTLEGLPNGIVPVSVRGPSGPGQKNWNAEVDFRVARHATVFIIADAHNRLRLRVAASGPTLAEEAESAKDRP